MDSYKIRNILNIVFMILAVASVIVYFTSDFMTFIYVAAVAIFVKVIEFIIRFTF